MNGTVYGLGVGPGDPDLITLKALNILRRVPVIAYPAPLEGDSLARSIVAGHLPGGQREIAIRMPMVAERFPAQEVYDRAAAEIGARLDAGEDVAVLCEGDPFFYGSFMYLFGRLAGDWPLEVVPGVSSLTACAAATAMPLAARNDSLCVLPAPLDDAALRARLATADAAAIIKVGRHLGRIRRLLKDQALLQGAVYIERASMAAQKIVPLAAAKEEHAPYFSMILVHRRGVAWQ